MVVKRIKVRNVFYYLQIFINMFKMDVIYLGVVKVRSGRFEVVISEENIDRQMLSFLRDEIIFFLSCERSFKNNYLFIR